MNFDVGEDLTFNIEDDLNKCLSKDGRLLRFVGIDFGFAPSVSFTGTHNDDRADVLSYAVQSMYKWDNFERDKRKRVYIKPTSVKLND